MLVVAVSDLWAVSNFCTACTFVEPAAPSNIQWEAAAPQPLEARCIQAVWKCAGSLHMELKIDIIKAASCWHILL